MTTPYDNWAARLRGETVKAYVESPEAGYWRKRIVGRSPNGASFTVGYHPVAFWPEGEGFAGLIDGKPLTNDECCNCWTYVSGFPITYEQYKAVAEDGGKWFDQDKIDASVAQLAALKLAAAPPIDDNTSTTAAIDIPEPPKVPEHELLLGDIKDFRKELDTYKEIEDEDTNQRVLVLRNAIAALRLKAERAQKAESAPHWKLYKDAMDRYAQTISEGKVGESVAKRLQDDWESLKLQQARIAQEAERKRLEEEAARVDQWVDQAVAADQAGEARPEMPVESAPVQSNMPPPSTMLKAGTGRARRVKPIKVVTITDQDAVYRHFADTDAVKTVLQQLAQAKVNSGETNIPGISIEERAST